MTLIDSIKSIIENEIEEVWSNKRAREKDKNIKQKFFTVEASYKKVIPIFLGTPEIFKTYFSIEQNISKKAADYAFLCVFRFSFLSQVVWNKGGAANYAGHWFTPPFERADPRWASYEECLQMFKTVIGTFDEALNDAEKVRNFKFTASQKFHCIDYKEHILDKQIHIADNVYWMWDAFPSRVIKLKRFLTNKKTNPETFDFFKKAYSKISVKAYLTDRSQTGGYQTNREKRWEAHPRSVHFALYRSCLEIEFTLIKQVLEFYGFPGNVIASLEAEGIVFSGEFVPESRRCPITMEKMVFDEFKEELENLTHGESRFQVGHINPLKANSTNVFVGHTAQNICWITDVGNEIQKNRSVAETRDLIIRISRNYEEAGILKTDT